MNRDGERRGKEGKRNLSSHKPFPSSSSAQPRSSRVGWLGLLSALMTTLRYVANAKPQQPDARHSRPHAGMHGRANHNRLQRRAQPLLLSNATGKHPSGAKGAALPAQRGASPPRASPAHAAASSVSRLHHFLNYSHRGLRYRQLVTASKSASLGTEAAKQTKTCRFGWLGTCHPCFHVPLQARKSGERKRGAGMREAAQAASAAGRALGSTWRREGCQISSCNQSPCKRY